MKSYCLLFHIVIFIYRKFSFWFEVIWSKKCKSYKEIQKSEKKKRRKKGKAATGPTREPDQPSSHRTNPAHPGFPLSPWPADPTCWHHHLRRLLPAEITASFLLLSLSPRCRTASPSTPRHSPPSPPSLPSDLWQNHQWFAVNLLAGVHHSHGQNLRNPVSPDHPAPPLLQQNTSPPSELTLVPPLVRTHSQSMATSMPEPPSSRNPLSMCRRCRRPRRGTPITHVNSPYRAAPHRGLRQAYGPLEHRRRPIPSRRRWS
jgi:hypothetical protein